MEEIAIKPFGDSNFKEQQFKDYIPQDIYDENYYYVDRITKQVIPKINFPVNIGTIPNYDFTTWLITNGTLVIASAFANGGLPVIAYTVPANYVLYIISATLSWRADAGAAGAPCQMLSVNDNAIIILMNPITAGTHNNTTANYSVPIKMIAGQTIKVTSPSAGVLVYGSFVGYKVGI